MKVVVSVKRVTDPNIAVQPRADGAGLHLENIKTTINPFDKVALESAVCLMEKVSQARSSL